eukprot:SAG11_NODE_1705_length_4412_cov_5.951078_8_plen_53_part_01
MEMMSLARQVVNPFFTGAHAPPPPPLPPAHARPRPRPPALLAASPARRLLEIR